MNRADEITQFLAPTDWAKAAHEPLGGDASSRRYIRLRGGPSPALLMDAPPATNAPVTAFLNVAAQLKAEALSAPEIYASSIPKGLVLLEDLGDVEAVDGAVVFLDLGPSPRVAEERARGVQRLYQQSDL